jgi:hypothetical protein
VVENECHELPQGHIQFTRSNNPLDFDAEEEQCFTTCTP